MGVIVSSLRDLEIKQFIQSVRIWLETPVFLLIRPVPFYSAAPLVNTVPSM